MRFQVDCTPQIRIIYLKSHCNQWGPWIGIIGQLAVCFSKLFVFIPYINFCLLYNVGLYDSPASHLSVSLIIYELELGESTKV